MERIPSCTCWLVSLNEAPRASINVFTQSSRISFSGIQPSQIALYLVCLTTVCGRKNVEASKF